VRFQREYGGKLARSIISPISKVIMDIQIVVLPSIIGKVYSCPKFSNLWKLICSFSRLHTSSITEAPHFLRNSGGVGCSTFLQKLRWSSRRLPTSSESQLEQYEAPHFFRNSGGAVGSSTLLQKLRWSSRKLHTSSETQVEQ
jgi:hypothetical protein